MEERVWERNVGGAERVVGTDAGRYILEGEKDVETRIENFIWSNGKNNNESNSKGN